MRVLYFTTTLLGLCLFLSAPPISAQLSPGELALPHAKLEGLSNCTQCHVVGERVPNDKCLDCHKEIQHRQNDKRGYHGGVLDQDCVRCHSDHNGREYQLIRWPEGGMDKFDHALTGYVLAGKHQQLACRDCHRADRVKDVAILTARAEGLDHTFLGVATTCSGCHTDVHQGQLGLACDTCHESDSWKPAPKFQHNQARFKLDGRHIDVACERCHVSEQNGDVATVRFRPVNFDGCVPCHQDVHKGRFQASCDACHKTSGWHDQKARKFDHNQTRFVLKGKHQKVDCNTCHGRDKTWHLPAFGRCVDCHQDVHGGQFGLVTADGACDRCHDETGFEPSLFDFESHQKSRFELSGAHAAVPCQLCHAKVSSDVPTQFHWDVTAFRCDLCHQSPHRDQFVDKVQKDGCETCHQVASWHDVTVRHEQTRFPLMGRHQKVACDACHQMVVDDVGKYRVYAPLNMACASCHRDVHGGQFGQGRDIDCGRCHANDNWLATRFQHNRDAQFSLQGAHHNVSCEKCHQNDVLAPGIRGVRYRPLGMACAACHRGM